MSTYLKENNVKGTDGTDVNSIMRDIMSIILEGALDKEMNEKLDILRDLKREFEPQVIKKYQNIESHMQELYDIEISDNTISRITQDTACRERIKVKISGRHLCSCFYGCHSLSCKKVASPHQCSQSISLSWLHFFFI